MPSGVRAGEIVSHEPDRNILYHWFSYVPANLNSLEVNYILIGGVNGNIVSDDYSKLIEECRKQISDRKDLAEKYGYIVLTPVIPRSASHWEIYTVSLDRESLLDPTDFNQRPDMKVNLMIEELSNTLKNNGLNIASKVFIEGFSAGAMFAQRYCLLHPEKVRAIAAGQCGGSLTVPDISYNGIDMTWPVGIKDFKELLKSDFNLAEYKNVPQFLYIGDQDTKSSTVAPGNYDLFTDEQRDFLNNNFGSSDPVRVSNQCAYMQILGCNVEFKLYNGVGHNYTSNILNDIFSFFAIYI